MPNNEVLKEELSWAKVLIVSLDPLSPPEVVQWGAEGYVSKIAAPVVE
jgi:hypothetical protein